MKKNGFTLIEVLGVIILLGVLSVIVVPVVRDSIKQSKRKAYDKQVNTILTTAREWAADNTNILANNSLLVKIETLKQSGLLENKQITNPVTNEEMQGCAKVSYNQEFNQYEYEYSDDCIEYSDILSSDDNCIKSSDSCNYDTLVKVMVNETETYNFYVINDDGNELTMIMDRNLYSAEDLKNGTHNVEYITASDYGDTTIQNNKGPLTALKVLKERTKDWSNIPTYTYTLTNDYDGRGGGHTYSDITGDVVTDVRARLPKFTELMELQSKNGGSLPNGLRKNYKNRGDENTYGYWTSTAHSSKSQFMWLVHCDGSLQYGSDVGTYGIRPVITVSKFAPIY